MKLITVPVFTEEYKIRVFFGNDEQRAKKIAKYVHDWSYEEALGHCEKSRGNAFNSLPSGDPLITIDEGFGKESVLSTLPHEAVHCAKYIADFLGINDSSGEWEGHIVSAVMRYCTGHVLKLKKSKNEKR